MRPILIAALLAPSLLAPTLAFADKTETSERTVKAGATVRLGHWYLVNEKADCKAGPIPTTSIDKQPTLGQLGFEQIQAEPDAAKCKGNIVPQVVATYKAGAKPGHGRGCFQGHVPRQGDRDDHGAPEDYGSVKVGYSLRISHRG